MTRKFWFRCELFPLQLTLLCSCTDVKFTTYVSTTNFFLIKTKTFDFKLHKRSWNLFMKWLKITASSVHTLCCSKKASENLPKKWAIIYPLRDVNLITRLIFRKFANRSRHLIILRTRLSNKRLFFRNNGFTCNFRKFHNFYFFFNYFQMKTFETLVKCEYLPLSGKIIALDIRGN